MSGRSKEVQHRLKKLESHLRNESPLLVDAVKGFKELDLIAYRLGLLNKNQSHATDIPWWPLVSVLGSDSKGKVSFLNTYLNYDLLDTENPEDEEKFTVISYARGNESRNLPGVALDADPRFPFYKMADKLEQTIPDSDQNVNDCLQLKTCPTKQAQGYIFINSPKAGFDTKCVSTVKISDHIIGMSDLVLVFIDANKAELSEQQDALEQLLSNKASRKYASKFVFILNRTDSDGDAKSNKEIAEFCQNVLSEEKLSSAKVLTLQANNSNESTASSECNPLETAFKGDTEEVLARIAQIYVDRIYRVLGNLHNQTRNLEQHTVSKLSALIRKWEKGVLWRDSFIFSFLGIIALVYSYSEGFLFTDKPATSPLASILEKFQDNISLSITAGIFFFMIVLVIHYTMRFLSKRSIIADLEYASQDQENENIKMAFKKNTRLYRSIFRPNIVGWTFFTRKRLRSILNRADTAIQKMNDKYTRPSGKE